MSEISNIEVIDCFFGKNSKNFKDRKFENENFVLWKNLNKHLSDYLIFHDLSNLNI